MAQELAGFPDWQRTVTSDSEVLVANTGVARVGPLIYGPFNVYGYGWLRGRVYSTGAPTEVLISWYADAALAVPLGERRFILHPNVGDYCWINFPNLGPYVEINYGTNLFNTAWTEQTTLIATNRPAPLPIEPRYAHLISAEAVAVAAGGFVTVWPTGYFAGPAQVWIDTLPASCFVRLFMLQIDGTGRFAIQWTGAGAAFREVVILPLGAWQIQFANLSAAPVNFYCSVVPSFAGHQ